MDTFELDKDDDYDSLCGEIYLTIKKYLVFRCLLCDCKFKNGFSYLWHSTKEHGTLGHNIVNRNLNKPNILLLRKPTADTAHIQVNNKIISEKAPFSHEVLHETPISIESVEQYKNNKNIVGRRSKRLRNKPINSQQQKPLNASLGESKETIIKKGSFQEVVLQESINKRKKPLNAQQKQPCASVASSPSVAEADNELLVPLNESTIYNDDKSPEKEKRKVYKTYECQNCPVISTSVRDFRRHREIHKKTYECPICFEVFQYCSTYTKHLNEHDIKDQCHRCDICSKGFATADDFTIHSALHTDEERADAAKQAYERPYRCPVCGFRMKDSANIMSHMRRHSEDNRRHECPDCSKKFFTRSELKTHSRQHTGERPFLCAECGEGFTSSGLLGKHKRTQHLTRKRSFECTICSSSFFEKAILKLHMRLHQDKRRYACSQCGAAFKQKTALTSHIKIHKNELTYKCKICEKRFNQAPALSSHMKTHKKLNFNKP